MMPPLVRGGCGRTDADTHDDARALLPVSIVLLAMLILATLCALVMP